jgi:hypothetical protein
MPRPPTSVTTRTASPERLPIARPAPRSCRGVKRARRRWLSWLTASIPMAFAANRRLKRTGEAPYRSWYTNDEAAR